MSEPTVGPASIARLLPAGSRARRGFGFGVAAVAIAMLSATLVCRRSGTVRERLLAESGPFRPTPGRLVGEGSYRPWRAAAAPRPSAPDLIPVLRRGEPPAGSRSGGEGLDRAVALLLFGDTERAIASLELATRSAETAAEALTDLSAAYLLRFETASDCIDLLRAVQAADRGLLLDPDIDPDNASIRFNRAKALSLLGTRTLARSAWRDVVNRERGAWREEAFAQLRELERPGPEQEWARQLLRLESPQVSASEIEAITVRFPASARTLAEEVLLPRWSVASAAGDARRAERSLATASSISAVLRRERGEELLSDALTSIRKTVAEGSPDRRAALIRGLQDFSAGVVQYNEQNLVSAKAPLLRSAADLSAVGNPLHFWARFYVAISEYYEDADRGLATLNGLLEAIPQDRYPALVGRIEWIAGTIDKAQGRIQSSVRRYERAAENLRRAGGDTPAAFVTVLLAESYTALGEYSLAWRHRQRAFHQVPFTEGPRRNVAMWTEAKEALVRQGHLALARPLVEEEVASAERWGRPLGRANAYLDRAVYRVEVGAREAALADLRQAKRDIAQMERSGLQEQMTSVAMITEGLCTRVTDPRKAAGLLQQGLERQGASGTRFDAITYTTVMAKAQVISGDVRGGASSLEHVLTMFEEIRATVEDPVSRMQAFRQAQPAFDHLIALRTDMGADGEEVFQLAERSRARVLLELRGRNGRSAMEQGDFVSLAELERILPPGVALASYLALDDRILVWVVQDGRSRRVTLRTSRAAIAEQIERFHLEVQRGGSVAAIRAVATTLYDALIRPLALSSSGHSLIVVPDRWLARLPFPALVDRQSGQYLIEQRAVTIAPSATLLVRSSQREHVSSSDLSALVVAVSRPGAYRGSSLPALPQAAEEGATIAGLYGRSSLLRDAQATRENFLRASPSYNVIHFAGHAVVDLEAPRRSVLLFAEGSGPSLQPLSLGELLDLGIGETRLVVLSACRTQDSLADDREGLLGLAGAFVAGGVSEVVASPWDVDDQLAPPVMAAFHRHYAQRRSAGVAFQHAVLELLRSGPSEASSPAAWGGFTVITGSLEKEGV